MKTKIKKLEKTEPAYKRTEKVLRKSERFALATLDALSARIAILDDAGSILAVNQAWRVFSDGNLAKGSDLKVYEGVNYLSVCETSKGQNFDEGLLIAAGIRAVMCGKQKEFSLEYTCHSSEEKRWFNVHVSRFQFKDSLRIVVAHENITERKQMEDLLRQTHQNYEIFFNTIDEFLFVLDEQGYIIQTNNKVTDRLGYTKEELLGKSVLMIHPPERRDEAGRIVSEMLSGVTEFCPVPIITKSGVQIPVETRVSQGFWDGKPVIFGVTKDISKVRLSEEKFSKLFHINPSACGLSDLESHEYIEVNDAFYTLLGFDKDEVIGKTVADLGILTTETANSIFLKSDSNGRVTNAEADLTAKNGDIKHVLLSAENIFIQEPLAKPPSGVFFRSDGG